MDSLRPDFLSCYGHEKETSPNIDALAREGVLFENAFAQSTWTRPSGASLLTSTYPSIHGISTFSDELSSTIPTFPEQLKLQGFTTIAVSSMGNISPAFGFGRGFDRFVELYKEEKVMARRERIRVKDSSWEKHFRVQTDEVPIATSEDINEFLFPFLEHNREEKLFIFIWSIDTHSPYFHRDMRLVRFCLSDEAWSPKAIESERTEGGLNRLKLLYEDMIYHNDYYIGLLIKKLKELNLFGQTFFILTSDHGEAFREHGFNSHGGAPYDELIQVPLVMRFPHSRFSGQISGLVQHIDVAPTVLEYAEVPRYGMLLQGKSLFPLLTNQGKVNDFIFVETQLSKKLQRFTALRDREYKYIEIQPGEFTFREWMKEREKLWPLAWFVFKPRSLFCVRDDPAEKINLIYHEEKTAKRFRSQMDLIRRCNWEELEGWERAGKKKVEPDEAVAKQLQALGYFDGK
jgi:arylsulfatase A-like enzyme